MVAQEARYGVAPDRRRVRSKGNVTADVVAGLPPALARELCARYVEDVCCLDGDFLQPCAGLGLRCLMRKY